MHTTPISAAKIQKFLHIYKFICKFTRFFLFSITFPTLSQQKMLFSACFLSRGHDYCEIVFLAVGTIIALQFSDSFSYHVFFKCERV